MEASHADSVSVEQARKEIAGEGANAIDVRGEEAWREGHIPGALLIAREDIEGRIEEIPSEGRIFVIAEKGGDEVASKLRDHGCDAAVVEGGMDAWKGADFTLQPSEDPDLEGEAPTEEGAGRGEEPA
jgi:rhodanese-related sulfurtransferase